MKDNKDILFSRQINPRFLYKIVVLTSSFFLMMLSLSLLLPPANIVLAQEEEDDDSPITTSSTSSRTTTSIDTNFNFAAAGDWGCTDDTTDTVNNILDKTPEIILGLGDYSYEDSPDCWFDVIQPIDNILKISIGNHDVEDLEALMSHFGLTEQYYSFDYQNVHFIALATEEEYLDLSNDKAKEQLAFVQSDLEKASSNPNIDWIIPFYHRIAYADCECGIVDSADHNLVDTYHPLFEKYGVHLVLQAHTHTYERTYPLKFNPEDSDDPIITSTDSSSNYRNIDGLVIATVGTAGAKPTSIHLSSELTAAQYGDLFGFLNVDVSSDGKTLVGTFYDNNDGEIKDKFTITKSSVSTSSQEQNDDDDDVQIVTKDGLQDESDNDKYEADDEVSAAVSNRENGNEEFSEGNQEDDDDYDVGLDDIDSILATESFFDEE
jgi:Calcineurin-like phosphoesterase